MASVNRPVIDRISSAENMGSEDDNLTAADEEISSDEEPAKDATELELEKLVFGNATGFKDDIKGFRKALAYGKATEAQEKSAEQDRQLAVIDDADVSRTNKINLAAMHAWLTIPTALLPRYKRATID